MTIRSSFLGLALISAMTLGCPDPPTPPDVDLDGDGWPDITDVCVDVDGDGYGRPENDTTGCVITTPDCDDSDADIHPEAPEICDARDNDCDEDVDEGLDGDGDGYTTCGADGIPGNLDDDCNDSDDTVHPGAEEACDGLDNDCDEDLPADEEDGDGDGFMVCEEDCDDADESFFPGAPELCDGLDNDCDGAVPADEEDVDGDGMSVCEGDCDDGDPATYNGANEACDGADNDCDQVVPDNELDADGDGTLVCDGDCDDADPLMNTLDVDGDGVTSCAGDCDDADAAVFPGATEVCNAIDDDCDGVVPEDETDDDGDGSPICDGDCDDSDPTRFPGATEDCDGVDNDCDGQVPANEDDVDGDTHRICDGDCDDGDGAVYPGADEGCDGIDTDCDGGVPTDEDDADGDGLAECEGDCDDTNADTYPGAQELCDGLDNDCTGTVPAQENDDDGDGFPECPGIHGDADCDDTDPAAYPMAPTPCDGTLDNDCDGQDDVNEIDGDGDGFSACAGDCDDQAPAVFPGAEETCNGVDDDCDPATDELADGDGDGYSLCTDDCDDGDPAVHPGAIELCNGADDDCNGVADDAADADGDGDDLCVDCDDGDPSLNYADADGDGVTSCDDDCDDGEPTVYPGAPQACDGIEDNDCDFVTDLNENDDDGDGYSGCAGDCDVNDPDVSPDGIEVQCDGIDQDCDGGDLIPAQASFSLSQYDAAMLGPGTYDGAGYSVDGAGDLDGDGMDDVVVGSQYADVLIGNEGKAWVIYGPTSGFFGLDSAAAILYGEEENDYLGQAVAGVGDVDGDGLDDLLVGAPDNDDGGSNAGKVYLVLGEPDAIMVAEATFTGRNPADALGESVSGGASVNGDAYDDILMGASEAEEGGGNSGAAYLFHGPVSGSKPAELANAIIYGGAGDRAGRSVAIVGDTNDDGYAEVLVGMFNDNAGGNGSGSAYLYHGPVSGAVTKGAADASFIGEEPSDGAGYSVADAGDVDGDGRNDILVGAYGNDDGGSTAGKVYLLYGPHSGLVDLSTADASFIGLAADDRLSFRALAGAGDVNGDGYDDVLAGASYASNDTGAAYLLYGPLYGDVDLNSATVRMIGENTGDRAGISVAGAGDTDGDGLDDILVGASGYDYSGYDKGIAYLLTGPVVCN